MPTSSMRGLSAALRCVAAAILLLAVVEMPVVIRAAAMKHLLLPITLNNAPSATLIESLTGHTSGVWTVAFSPDGKLLASGAQDGQVLVRSIDSLAKWHRAGSYTGWIVGLAFSPDSRFLAYGAADGFAGAEGRIGLWNIEADTLERTLFGHSGGCWSIDFQESTGRLVSGSFDRTVRIWDPSTGAEITTLSGHTAQVLSVDFNPTQNLIASSGVDYTVRIWNSETGSCVCVLRGHSGNVGYVKFSPDGTKLASSADDGTVRMWNFADSSLIWSQPAGQGWVNCVNFSPDGSLLVTCGHDGSVALRDAASGALLKRLSGHLAPVLRGAFSPDGTILATASWDNTVRLWGVEQDTDSDSVPDDVDNCPDTPNQDQIDTDHDGLGDACCCVGNRGNVNYTGIIDLADLSALVSYLTAGGYTLPCPNGANVNASGIVDLADLSAIVSYLTGGGYLLPNCPV
ncbi:hypothetical protein C3F09_11780 [candidate division GN15 bacterium]|uniref:WD40 repeat domain-containing protein n=1 Tax=candidate division GN15 bacterium TaxID=2072418 RepID=A0A855X063_9BACT|nr:MAG: hypothetical protein C3F09_11780 [candidate division GN15 bacterium]